MGAYLPNVPQASQQRRGGAPGLCRWARRKTRRGGEPAAARAVLAEHIGRAPEESTGGGTSDARFIAPLGAQCIEVGPVNASIHQVDENVRVDELEALPGLYQRLVERLLV